MMMAQLTIRMPEPLRRQMKRFREVNWSEVTRKAIEARILLEMTRRQKDRHVMVEAAKMQDEIARILASRYTGPWSGVEVIRYWRRGRYSSWTPQ